MARPASRIADTGSFHKRENHAVKPSQALCRIFNGFGKEVIRFQMARPASCNADKGSFHKRENHAVRSQTRQFVKFPMDSDIPQKSS